jgi:ComF family protein
MYIKERLGQLLNPLSVAARMSLDMVLPPRCFACGESITVQGHLCASCWSGLNFITNPQCSTCGLPFEFESIGEGECGACLSRPPAYDHARSALYYDDGCRSLILGLKHGDRTALAQTFAQWMARVAVDLVEDDTIVIPVPLHRWRLLSRRYNQSALMAVQLAKLLKRPHTLEGVYRKKPTPSQGGLSASERRANVKTAFALRANALPVLVGRSILLVDDVFTTGATVEACAKTLKSAHVRNVKVVTAARVVTPQIQVI